MIALQASAVLMWLVAAGFGIPAPFVASYYLRERTRIGHGAPPLRRGP